MWCGVVCLVSYRLGTSGEPTAQSDVYWLQHCKELDGLAFVVDAAAPGDLPTNVRDVVLLLPPPLLLP